MRKIYLISVFLVLPLGFLYAQKSSNKSNPNKQKQFHGVDDLLNQIEKQRKKVLQNIDKLPLSDLEKTFNKKFKSLIKKFNHDSFDDFFKDDYFKRFFKNWGTLKGSKTIDHQWIENAKEKILIIDTKSNNNDPVNIEIKKNTITIKGTSTKKISQKTKYGISEEFSRYSFNQSFTVPPNLDPNSANIKNRNGKIMIIFTKQNLDYRKLKQNKKRPVKKKGITPLRPKNGDNLI